MNPKANIFCCKFGHGASGHAILHTDLVSDHSKAAVAAFVLSGPLTRCNLDRLDRLDRAPVSSAAKGTLSLASMCCYVHMFLDL